MMFSFTIAYINIVLFFFSGGPGVGWVVVDVKIMSFVEIELMKILSNYPYHSLAFEKIFGHA